MVLAFRTASLEPGEHGQQHINGKAARMPHVYIYRERERKRERDIAIAIPLFLFMIYNYI